MGQARTKQYNRKKLLEMHPYCIYCGALATTTDHCPPRALFRNRIWPEGYEFAACEPCNSEGASNESVISVIYQISLGDNELSENLKEQFKGLKNNRPDIVAEWLSDRSRNWIRQSLREDFGPYGDEMRNAGYQVIRLGKLSHECIDYFGKKLLKALFYKNVGKRLDGPAYSKSVSLLRFDAEPILEISPIFSKMERSTKPLHDQFGYRYNFSSEHEVFIGIAGFKEQLGYSMFACSNRFWQMLDPVTRSNIEDAFKA